MAWLVAAVAMVWLSIIGLREAEGVALVAIYAGLGCGTAKLATESVRRLHDCGQSGRRGIGPVLGIVALFLTAVLNSIGYGLDGVSSGALVLAIVALAVLLLRRGTNDANRFGPPPRLLRPNDERSTIPGTVCAACVTLSGLTLGLAVLQWQTGMVEQRERRMRFQEKYVEQADPLATDLPTGFTDHP